MESRTEATVRVRTLLVWGVVLLLAIVWFAWWKWEALSGAGPSAPPVETAAAPPVAPPPGGAAAGGTPVVLISDLEEPWRELTGAVPDWPTDAFEPEACSDVEEDLRRVCRVLDSRPYVSERLRPGGSCALLAEVAELLAENPPVLSSELRSYDAILENVFHLFRNVGRTRVTVLREMLREEERSAEPLAFVVYRWLASRQACARERGETTRVRSETLYEYAGFLFQTMGGQAYLRRRTPRVEALTGFYAVLALDRTIEQSNPLGLDPRPELVRTRALLETQPLLFRDRYLAQLADIERRWSRRGD